MGTKFGYTPGLTDEDRENLLSKSTQPEYIFGTDGYQTFQVNIDPRNYRGDMSNDPITYTARMKHWCQDFRLPIYLVDGKTSTLDLLFIALQEKKVGFLMEFQG